MLDVKHKSIECATRHRPVSGSQKRERPPPPLITSSLKPANRTQPFFIRRSFDVLSLKDGDEWQWGIAITGGEETYSYRSRCGGVYGRYRPDRMWSERRGYDAHLSYSPGSHLPEHVYETDAWHEFCDLRNTGEVPPFLSRQDGEKTCSCVILSS